MPQDKQVPEGQAGLWSVAQFGNRTRLQYQLDRPWLDHTVVMENTPKELEIIDEVVKVAHGNVLVTGLGLGLVLKRLSGSPAVRSITCVELSEEVISLVWDHVKDDKMTLVHEDAFNFVKRNKELFDFAYHDLWTLEGNTALSELHLRLIDCCARFTTAQMAWMPTGEIARSW